MADFYADTPSSVFPCRSTISKVPGTSASASTSGPRFFVDSIIWRGNRDVLDSAPIWCDLSTHFINGFSLAISAYSLCVNRRLY
ncbi:Pheromone B alpha 1 receptor [Mycena sanguinolenta]|uniref:Pheromone B alpha 1 receptor n=1 Tax=Mycena sanguinolenta TaxID=230812 RepID=A0A8H6Z8Y9_9AGAR|nr:Pheromone B alpha 1 receptor [Mycena sanguinolenta]